MPCLLLTRSLLFFSTDPPTTQIYTLSLHDALPILLARLLLGEPLCFRCVRFVPCCAGLGEQLPGGRCWRRWRDRKSTRLNSSHQIISYAVFCLKKKK